MSPSLLRSGTLEGAVRAAVFGYEPGDGAMILSEAKITRVFIPILWRRFSRAAQLTFPFQSRGGVKGVP